ncbi:hypothetical protein [Mesorhizobium sp. LjRoot246]|uniref:hypothetical protein n=1 Tax=Mesorhizobium sp. LjRoot246 TaxID=3342294 RepID=UPI003ED06AB5
MKPLLEGHEDPITVLVAREIEAISDTDILGWANRHKASEAYAEDADYLQLRRSNPRNATSIENTRGHLLSLIARHFPGFNERSKEAEQIARKLFLRRLQAYLEGEIKPSDICCMVSPIEHRYDFPAWLGDLFNACDWLDERATPEQLPHLRNAIEQTLAANADFQRSGSK